MLVKQDNHKNLLLSSRITKITEILRGLSTKEKITFISELNKYIEDLIDINLDELTKEEYNSLTSYIENILPIILEIPFVEGNYSIIEKILMIKNNRNNLEILNKLEDVSLYEYINENIAIINTKKFEELSPDELLKIDKFLSMIGKFKSNKIDRITMLKYRDFMRTIEEKDLAEQSTSIKVYENRVFDTLPNIMEKQTDSLTQDLNYYFIDEYINKLLISKKNPLEINFTLEFNRYMRSDYCYSPIYKNQYQSLIEKLNIPDLETDVSEYKKEINKYNFKDYNRLLQLVENNYYMNKKVPSSIALFILNKFIKDNVEVNEVCIKSCLNSIFVELLEKTGNKGYTVSFLPDSAIKNRQGKSNSKKRLIKIRDKELQDFILKKDPEVLTVLFHEIVHVIQKSNIEEDKLDYNHYQMLKDFIIMTSDNDKYKDYYANNYKNISFERDANKYQIIYTLNLMEEIDKEYAKKYEKIYIERYEQENKKLITEHHNNRKVGEKKIKIDTLFDKFIKENPILLKSFDNRMLKLEYYNDGERKPLGILVNEFAKNNFINFGVIYDQESFIDGLIKNRTNLNKEEILNDISSLVYKEYENKNLDNLVNNYLQKQLRSSIINLKMEDIEGYNQLFEEVKNKILSNDKEINIEKTTLVIGSFDGNLVNKKELLSTINRR